MLDLGGGVKKIPFSKNISWAFYDHVVAQKSIFWEKKILKKNFKIVTLGTFNGAFKIVPNVKKQITFSGG